MSLTEWADGLMQALENDNNTSSTWYTYAQLAKQYNGRYIDLSKSANPFGSAAFTDVSDFVFSDVDWLGGLLAMPITRSITSVSAVALIRTPTAFRWAITTMVLTCDMETTRTSVSTSASTIPISLRRTYHCSRALPISVRSR